MKKSFTWAFLCVFLSLLVSCGDNSGLGEELDLEAPVISVSQLESDGTTVTSFGGGVYCHKSVTFTGTATDNHSVSSVYVQKKYSSESDYSTLKTASLSGSTWTVSLDLPDEGVCFLKFVAADDASNSSAKSSKVVTLFIDESAPVASAWYIDRNLGGITYNLKEKETLESLDLTLPENKDAAQNVSFSIKATATDTMGIDKITLKICDENENQICEVENSSENQYAPEFEITHELLVAGDESLASGKHYLQIKYDASDIVTVPAANAAENVVVDAGYFIWWPESDEPKISQSDIQTDSEGSEYLEMSVDSVASLDIFDDDQLAKAYCALLTEDEYSAFGTPDWTAIQENPSVLESAVAEDAREKRFKEFTGESGQRETNVALTTASKAQSMHLLAFAYDGTDAKKSVTKDITVYVSDSNSPLLIISSPKNNSVPAVSMSSDNSSAEVTVEGQSLDVNGCSYLEFVWVSASVDEDEKASKAKTWLESISSSSYAPSSGENQKATAYSDGTMKLWSVALTDGGTAGDYVKQTFSFSFDLLNDFTLSDGTNEKAEEKFFIARISRSDGKYTYSQYKLAADTDIPTIVSVSPAQDMEIVPTTAAYTIKFYASKSSGLAIDTSKYGITVTDNACTLSDEGYDSDGGYYKATISESELITMMNSSLKPNFVFTASDIFGNKAEASYTLVISNVAQLKSISSGNSGTAKLGDTITINASFTSAVSVDEGTTPFLKLKGITNSVSGVTSDDIVKANYVSGSGSTTLVFSYEVQAGDSCSKLLVYNETDSGPIDANGAASLSSDKVYLTGLSDDNNLQAKKTIKIDGIAPNVSGVSITTDVDSGNEVNGIDYVREGKTITAKVTVDDSVYIQGTPSFTLTSGSGTISLPYQSSSGTTITFSKKIESTDANGEVSYVPSSCVSDYSAIVDSAGNALVLQSDSSSTAANITVDTVAPSKPTVTIANTSSLTLTSGVYYGSEVTFTVTTESGATTNYSLKGGSDGQTYSSEVTCSTDGSYQLTAWNVDYAGNVSDYSDIIQIEISGNFPTYSVEITNADGNYKAGSTLYFKVSFDSNVNVPANSSANIPIVAYTKGSSTETDGTIGTSSAATLSSSSAQTNVSSVTFAYKVQDPDEFSPGVAENSIDLTGFYDSYGNKWGNKVNTAITRSGIVCDGVAPKVSKMTPSGETSSASNIYSSGNVITLVFSEEVQKASGNITLRQVDGWAIPPVLSASDFNTILGELSDDDDKQYLALLDDDGSYLEDAQPSLGIGISSNKANYMYHGSGQYAGPYRKSMQGIEKNSSGYYVPDTDTKFVLDFDIGIWETDTSHYYGKTYTELTSASSIGSTSYWTSSADVSTPSNLRTAQGIRDVLEKTHYHERVLDVTSSAVVIGSDSKTVTITFPAGLCDTSATLPYGRKWELIIDKGAFMDETGNNFGAEADGSYSGNPAYQSAGTQTASTSSNIRSITDDDNELVLIYDSNGSAYFWSDKVAAPVVRVDRYSYGLGIYQSDSTGNKASQIAGSSSTNPDSVKPTGYVRVRIDCETEGASLSYTSAIAANSLTSSTISSVDTSSDYYYTNGSAYSYLSTTSSPTSLENFPSGYTTSTGSGTSSIVFAGGNGNYKNSFKQFIVALGTKTGFTSSETGAEGIYQTVIQFVSPTRNNGTTLASLTSGSGSSLTDFSVRGTTGYGGEPYISPFPLRGSAIGTPYLRRTFRENAVDSSSSDYYWVSYEILVQSTILGHGSNGNGPGWTWTSNGSKLLPGEYTYVTGIKLYN